MSKDVNAVLMELLGILSEATRKITDALRGVSPQHSAPRDAKAVDVLTIVEPAPTNALDRIQEFEPGPAAAEAQEEAPKKRGRRGKLPANFNEIVKGLYIDKDMSAKEIGEKFGVSHGTVAQRVMKLGLSKRGPSPAKGKKRK